MEENKIIKEKYKKYQERLIEAYNYLGVINRKISILSDLTKLNKRDRAIKHVIDAVSNFSKADVAVLCKCEKEYLHKVFLKYKFHNGSFVNNGQRIKISELAFLNTCVSDKKSIRSYCVENDFKKMGLEIKFNYFLALPIVLKRKDETKGLIFLGFHNKIDMDLGDLEFLEVFMAYASSALIGSGVFKI